MPEPATPPAPPAAPPTTPSPDPYAPQPFVPMTPENDPDLQLKQMISRRRKPAAPAPPSSDAPAAPAAPPEPPKPDAEPPKPPGGFNDAIANVLRFKPAKKKVDAPAPPPADPPAAPAAAAPPAAPPAEPPKTIVGKKKATPAPPPAPDITDITTAATTAAVRALRGEPKTDTAKKPEDDLAPEDRHDYDVAVKLAQINPKYKDAPRVILDHVKKTDAYVARWEAANPGKVYDPDDDDHNEFFSTLEKPWEDHEFRKAERKLDSDEETEQIRREVSTKITSLERDNARLELNPIVERTFIAAAGHMARKLEVFDKLSGGDYDKFREEDPITAEAMGAALAPVQPLIEAIVQLDDPKGRFHLDKDNPAHQAWLELLAEKEAQYAGTESTDGKMFATRVAFRNMNDAQRARHWYLTPDHLVTEVVNDAVALAVERVKTEKDRQKKIALSLGYVPASELKTPDPKSPATNGPPAAPPAEPPPSAAKPVSPSVGSGAKIDAKGTPTPTGRAATMAAIGDILFRPGNAVP